MTRYDTLYACYLSGQMSESDMMARLREDDMFAAYVKRRLTPDAND